MDTTKLKLTLLKISKISAYIVTGGLVVSGVSAYAIQFLPPEAYASVASIIDSSKQALSVYGVGSTLSGLGMGTFLLSNKVINSSQSTIQLGLDAKVAKMRNEISQYLDIKAKTDERVVERQNRIIEQNAMLIKQNEAIIGFEVINAQRNINSPLVGEEVTALYKAQINKTAQSFSYIKPIVTVIERTVEVVREVEQRKSDRL